MLEICTAENHENEVEGTEISLADESDEVKIEIIENDYENTMGISSKKKKVNKTRGNRYFD